MENNFNPETMNNIKNLVDSGNISDAISQISPEMIENFSKMLNSNGSDGVANAKFNSSNESINAKINGSNVDSSYSNNNSSHNSSDNKQNTYNKNSSGSSFDFSQIDMNTIIKMKSVMEKMNNKNDPRSNLLYSLKPYLRQTKQDKLDQYVNLLNFSKVAEIFKSDKKDDNNA